MKKIIILGGHGDGLVAAQVIADKQQSGEKIELVGFLNDNLSIGEPIEGIPVLGAIKQWHALGLDNTYYFHPALHKVKQMSQRKELIHNLKIPLERIATLIHPTAVIAASAEIMPGCLICSYVTIQPGVKIGAFNSIRAGANIGHNAKTDDFCYIGPNATMTGNATLKEGAHLGPNAVITDGITLEKYAVAGAGAAIMQRTDSHSIYIGNPARKIMTMQSQANELQFDNEAAEI
jgi:sugar O-acyltransferase (sialic acid O-acetyltransferase NeuD family)